MGARFEIDSTPMATMATRVRRAWAGLQERLDDGTQRGPSIVSSWIQSELIGASSHVRRELSELRTRPVWQILLTAPDSYAVPLAKWNEFVAAAQKPPPTHDPERLFEWTTAQLWKLCVFTDPDDVCDEDQYDLELWWSSRRGRAVFVCGLDRHRWEFRRSIPSEPCMPPHAEGPERRVPR